MRNFLREIEYASGKAEGANGLGAKVRTKEFRTGSAEEVSRARGVATRQIAGRIEVSGRTK